MLDLNNIGLERRSDGAVIVRVPSETRPSGRLPDAQFAFRSGDPQYVYWNEQLQRREAELQQSAGTAQWLCR